MVRVSLIHWRPAEAEVRAAGLRAQGFAVDAAPFEGLPSVRALRRSLPDCVAIDLSRLPSQGREVACALRRQKATRRLPIVLLDCPPEKRPRIQQLLPEVVFASWNQAAVAIRRAIKVPPSNGRSPGDAMAAYAGVPLVRKLGIKPGSSVLLAGAPQGFEQTLQGLPAGTRLLRVRVEDPDLVLWFVRRRRQLEAGIAAMTARTRRAGLWILWPKQGSPLAANLTQAIVRKTGLAAGLVDFKICAVDSTWSGLRFALRRAGRRDSR